MFWLKTKQLILETSVALGLNQYQKTKLNYNKLSKLLFLFPILNFRLCYGRVLLLYRIVQPPTLVYR